MRTYALLLVSLFTLSCGGVMQGKTTYRLPASVSEKPSSEVIEQWLFLSALQTKYEQEQKVMNLAIVRTMRTKLEENYPTLPRIQVRPTFESLRKRPEFLSLEFTIEHLSHRNSVKLSAIP